MLIVRDFSNMFQRMSGMPVNSRGGQDMLKRAGIDTNSRQYQAVMQSMSEHGGVGYTKCSGYQKQDEPL